LPVGLIYFLENLKVIAQSGGGFRAQPARGFSDGLFPILNQPQLFIHGVKYETRLRLACLFGRPVDEFFLSGGDSQTDRHKRTSRIAFSMNVSQFVIFVNT
jgi:hypothetical protein